MMSDDTYPYYSNILTNALRMGKEDQERLIRDLTDRGCKAVPGLTTEELVDEVMALLKDWTGRHFSDMFRMTLTNLINNRRP